MELASRSFPLGAQAYEYIEPATRMVAKLFEQNPYLVTLPKVASEDSVLYHTLENIPGIKFKDGKIVLKIGTNVYKQGMAKLDKAFNNPTKKNLEHYSMNAPFLEKYLQIIKKFKSKNPYISLIGPFSISQLLLSAAEEQVLADKSYRKLFIQSVAIKALWIIEKIKEVNPEATPIIVLEEPYFSRFGLIKRNNEDITVDIVINMFSRVIEKIKSVGAKVAIHSPEKCDWQIPISAGVDIISFDAYNNPNNLSIIPEKITEFLQKGGLINWAIVPTMTEAMVKSLNVEYIMKRLVATMQGLMLAGVPEKLVYNSALVSIQGDVDSLPVIFAEKAVILVSQLAKKIPTKI